VALCDVDALLGSLDRLIAKKRELKQAVMQQLLTGQSPQINNAISPATPAKIHRSVELAPGSSLCAPHKQISETLTGVRTAASGVCQFLPSQSSNLLKTSFIR